MKHNQKKNVQYMCVRTTYIDRFCFCSIVNHSWWVKKRGRAKKYATKLDRQRYTVCAIGANKQRFCCVAWATATRNSLGIYRSMLSLIHTLPTNTVLLCFDLDSDIAIAFALKLSRNQRMDWIKRSQCKKCSMQIGVCILKRIFLWLLSVITAIHCGNRFALEWNYDRHGFVWLCDEKKTEEIINIVK